MIPILFPYNTAPSGPFEFNSLGRLGDALTCKVTEAYGDHSYQYSLEMTYPATGRHFEELTAYNIILAVPSMDAQPQPFRIRKVTRPIGGVVTVYADHISYDLDGFPVYIRNNVTGPAAAMAAAANFRGVTSPFYLYTNLPEVAKTVTAPKGPVSSREFLLMAGGVQDTFGGEWLFDKNQAGLLSSRGKDSGLILRRGKNISGLEQDETTEESFSGIFPFWQGGDVTVVLPEYVLSAPGKYIDAVAIVDFSREFKKKPTAAQLRAKAHTYLESKIRPQPTLSTSVDFVLLSQTLEYKELAAVESLHLYDTVHVVYDTLNIDVKTKVCKTVYDVLLDRYESVEVGAVKQNVYKAVKRITDRTVKASASTGSSGASDFLSVTKSISDSSERVSLPTGTTKKTVLSITAPTSGHVICSGYIQITANSTGNRHAELVVGGVTVSQETQSAHGAQTGMIAVNGCYPVNEGETIEAAAWQSSGSTLYAGGALHALFMS